MTLSDAQLERYARHIILKEIGGAGQKKLLCAKVLVVGAGGIGAPALLYLAAAGVGEITIVDDDKVSLTNLQRQVLYRSSDVGKAKTAAAADALTALNPDPAIKTVEARLGDENARELLRGHDLVIDGSDNFATRFAVNAACLALKIPLLSAAVGPFEGQLALFKGYRADLPCYRCFVPAAPPGEDETCADQGVLGALTGVVGAMAALEAVKEIVGFGATLAGRLLIYDALAARSRTVKLPKDPRCQACC